MADFKEIRRQTGIQKIHSTSQKEVRRREIWDKLITWNIQDSTQSLENLKHISKDVKETARIQGSIRENLWTRKGIKVNNNWQNPSTR
jgi:ribosomal protein L17